MESIWNVFLIISAELKECVTLFMYFLDLHQVRYNCAKFHNCRICVADFRFQEGGPFLLPLSVSSPEKTQQKINSQPICEIKPTQKKQFFSFFRMSKTYMFTFDSLSINDGHAKNVLQDIKHYKSRQRRKKNVNILLYQLLLISSCQASIENKSFMFK